MYTFTNSIKNIYRYRSKYRTFGVLYFILFLAAAICVNITFSSNKISDNILHEYASVVRIDNTYKYDIRKKELRPTKAELNSLKEIQYIDNVRFLKYVFNPYYTKEGTPEPKMFLQHEKKTISWSPNAHNFYIIGYDPSLIYLETKENLELEKGRMFDSDNEAVIYKNRLIKELDEIGWNELDLNDKITVKCGDIEKEFTIVGILEQDPEVSEFDFTYIIYTTMNCVEAFEPIANEYRSLNLYKRIVGDIPLSDFISIGYDTLLYLDSPENYTPLHNIMNESDIRITTLFSDANALINMANAMKISCIMYIIVLSIFIICVTIISTNILLSTRKYEIAVLRSVGMKKSRLILSFLIENLAFVWGITLIALVAAQFISPIFTNSSIAEISSMLSPEMLASITNTSPIILFFSSAGIVFGGTTAIVMLSLIMTIINIVHFEPLKIFSKQY